MNYFLILQLTPTYLNTQTNTKSKNGSILKAIMKYLKHEMENIKYLIPIFKKTAGPIRRFLLVSFETSPRLLKYVCTKKSLFIWLTILSLIMNLG